MEPEGIVRFWGGRADNGAREYCPYADSQIDEVASAVATDCPASGRHGRILNCKDERRKDTPKSPQHESI